MGEGEWRFQVTTVSHVEGGVENGQKILRRLPNKYKIKNLINASNSSASIFRFDCGLSKNRRVHRPNRENKIVHEYEKIGCYLGKSYVNKFIYRERYVLFSRSNSMYLEPFEQSHLRFASRPIAALFLYLF